MSSLCDNPFTIPAIDLDECVGTSLATINSNFQDLKENICLTYDEIERVEENLIELSALCTSLSTYFAGSPKAFVNFDASTIPPTIKSSLNVASVSAIGTGMFALSFTTAFPTISYALLGTCKETERIGDPPGFIPSYVWVQPTNFTTVSADINIRNEDGLFANPEYVSIIIFNK